MPALDVPAGQPGATGQPGGFTTQVPRDAAATPPEVEQFNKLAQAWKAVGVNDITKLDPRIVAQSFERLQQLSQEASPQALDRRARAMAQEMIRASQAAGEGEEEPEAEKQSDLEKIMERLERIESGGQQREETEANLSEQATFQQQWANEYAGLQRAYPVLTEPAIDRLFRTTVIGHLATTNDPAADDPGYVTRIAPGFLQAFVEANAAFNAMIGPSGEGSAQGGAAGKSFTPEEIGALSDDDFQDSLRPYIRAVK